MAEEFKTEYDQYAPKENGRLFSNAMFGFNKEQVLEYLEELADENNQRQEMATQRIQELDAQLKQTEMNVARTQQLLQEQQPKLADAEMQKKLEELANALQISREASMQAEDELAEAKEKLFTSQNENNWLREEHQKTDKQIAELRRQLDEASQGQWYGAEEQITELRRQLEESLVQQRAAEQEKEVLDAEIKALEAEREVLEAERDAAEAEREAAEAERDAAEAERDAAEAERNMLLTVREGQETSHVADQTTRQLVAEATQEAEHVKKLAYAERDRLHRQLLNGAGGLVDNITCIREDITAVEGEVTTVLESVQDMLAELLVSLNHTEQGLSTLDIQIERFPSASPSVAKQKPMHFQPVPVARQEQIALQNNHQQPLVARATNGLGQAEFHRVSAQQTASRPKAQLFRPSFTNSSATGAYYTQTARTLPVQEVDTEEERMKALTDTLVNTLRQMLE